MFDGSVGWVKASCLEEDVSAVLRCFKSAHATMEDGLKADDFFSEDGIIQVSFLSLPPHRTSAYRDAA